MVKKVVSTLLLVWLLGIISYGIGYQSARLDRVERTLAELAELEKLNVEEVNIESFEVEEVMVVCTSFEPVIEVEVGIIEEVHRDITEEEKVMLARLMFSEAGNQGELGQRAVFEVVMNRRDCETDFPDTVKEVISEEGQFSGYNNSNYWKDDYIDILPLVEELIYQENIYSREMMFFKKVSENKEWKGVRCDYYVTIGDHDFYSLRSEENENNGAE